MDGKMMDDIFEALLEATGGLEDINTAIDSKDLAAIVRAAMGALRKTSSIPMRITEKKSHDLSTQLRKQGNLFYINKDYRQAIISYNKALAYAPNGSLELKIAFSNISAVMLNIGAYQACQSNIQAALDLDCPAFLRVKLEKRWQETLKHIHQEMLQDLAARHDKDMMRYLAFDVRKHVDITSASVDVKVGADKKVVAAADIKTGTMVVLEKAFVSVRDSYNEYTSCYYCHKICLFLIPCEGCCKALFCTKLCRDKCLEDYHRIECHIVAYMGTMYVRDENKLAVRAAIKMSLKLTWEQLSAASLQFGKDRLKNSTVSEAFDVNSPISLLCYDDQVNVDRRNMINASLICASAVHCLDGVPDYMPEDAEEREKAISALSRIMLHLKNTFLRKISVLSSAYDFKCGTNMVYKCGVQRNEGWFSLASKLPHACEPNLMVLGFNDHVGLIALRRIKKGDQLTISYINHFYELNNIRIQPRNISGLFRQKLIFNSIQYMCTCRVCLQGWDSQSPVAGKLTSLQKKAYYQYEMAIKKPLLGFRGLMKAIGAAMDELCDCPNTTQHCNLYGDLRRTLTECQCAKNLNKTYGGISKYQFIVDNSE